MEKNLPSSEAGEYRLSAMKACLQGRGASCGDALHLAPVRKKIVYELSRLSLPANGPISQKTAEKAADVLQSHLRQVAVRLDPLLQRGKASLKHVTHADIRDIDDLLDTIENTTKDVIIRSKRR